MRWAGIGLKIEMKGEERASKGESGGSRCQQVSACAEHARVAQGETFTLAGWQIFHHIIVLFGHARLTGQGVVGIDRALFPKLYRSVREIDERRLLRPHLPTGDIVPCCCIFPNAAARERPLTSRRIRQVDACDL